MRGLIRFCYPMIAGSLFGLIQTGLFLQLSFTLSSSLGTYLMVTLAWLTGGAIGITFLADKPLKILLIVMLAGYAIVNLLLNALPFQTGWWWLYALIILATGFYPGAFFAFAGKHYPARVLFFRENNGFIGGIIAGTILFALYGRVILWALPLILTAILLIIPGRLIAESP